MDILPNEVESVKTIGTMFDDEVKVIKTHGGFYVAVGKRGKKKKAEALAAGSHAAIVNHQISKEYGADFQPSVFKSESEQLEKVENKTQYLPSSSISAGIDLYTLSKSNQLEFVLYKQGVTLGSYKAEAEGGKLIIKSHEFKNDMIKADKQIAQAFSKAMRDKMSELGLEKAVKKYL